MSAPAPEGTIITAPGTGDDSAALLAELRARHAPRAAPGELDWEVVQPGGPSPPARLEKSAPAEGRSAKTARAPNGSDKAVPAPERKETTAPTPAGPAKAPPMRNDVELPAPMAAPPDVAMPARVGADPVAPPEGTLTLAPPARVGSETGVPPSEPQRAAPPRVSDPYTPAMLNDTGATPSVAEDSATVWASQGHVDGTSLLPSGDGPAAQPTGRDTAAVTDLPPTPTVPTTGSPGEPTTRPIEFSHAGFALSALVPSSAPPAPTAAPWAEGRLTAGPGSADFGSQLGAQLTTFVREGVQHARLHLHPAELGPVTVRIQIDGPAAQVHLAADNAFTRQALEQSMPQLAGSLREAGLTLSGGGVFEHPPRRDDATQGRPGGDARRPRDDEPAAETVLRPLAAAPRRRGVVDLVA